MSRFRRWADQGVWDALLQILVDLGLTDDWQHMIDSTTARSHVSAAGGKGGALAQAFGRSRGGFTSKVHARCDNQGLPVGFILTGGEASDYTAADDLMALNPRHCSPTRATTATGSGKTCSCAASCRSSPPR